MAKLTAEMKSFFGNQLPFVATVNPDGTPNIGPKRSTRIIDDETIAYSENTSKQTRKNIETNGKATMAIVDWEKLDGYRFICDAKIITEGEEFEKFKVLIGNPDSKAVGILKIKKIQSLKLGAAFAGETVAE